MSLQDSSPTPDRGENPLDQPLSERQAWSRLLSPDRLYMGSSTRPPSDERSEFERDYDRLIFASPFRRLQDKAQVFPLEHNDFVRTRLTHSLEVSTLGRSLGRQVGRQIGRKSSRELELGPLGEELGTIVATTCLAHDIGNPPFGHFGEDAIKRWFKDHASLLDGMTGAQQQDFLRFDGNAQGLRILTFLQSLGYDNGLNLTCTTLASFMKYVCPSDRLDKSRKSHQKVGYFQSEAAKVQRIREVLQWDDRRHPLVFLMEAADDIAYSVVDIEDGFKKKVLNPDTFVGKLEGALQNTDFIWLVRKFKESLTKDVSSPLSERINAAIQWFRINAIGVMFQATVETFLAHQSEILAGTFHQELIEASSARALHAALKQIGVEDVYGAPEILQLEVFGDTVIRGLLDRFVPACLSEDRLRRKTLEGKLYALISPSMRALQEKHTQMTPYDRMQLAVDHICGMTDTYAVLVYEKLNGRGSL